MSEHIKECGKWRLRQESLIVVILPAAIHSIFADECIYWSIAPKSQSFTQTQAASTEIDRDPGALNRRIAVSDDHVK